MSQTAIPEFFVYGEPARALDVGFLHVETVQARASVHRGQVLAHKHPQMAQITFWTSGQGVYRIEDKTWSFSAPTVSFMPSGVVHGFDIEPGTDAIVVSVADAALAAIADHSALPLDQPVFVTARGDAGLWQRLGDTVRMIQAEYAEAQAGAEKILPPLIAVALSHIARLDAQSHAIAMPAAVALGGRLRRLIDRHFRDDWPVERYVEELGTTRHLLDNAAHQVLGSGVRQAIGERRLVEAKRLLLFTIRTVEDIAYETGFNDPAYFSRFFRQAVGVAPAAWRKERLGSRQ
ncbi:helix-turn-helix domain-containing protein [Mesorhizobium sp. M2D.F.Ca.ET.185.01.1.1]|uniref:helix-turn-helix domain-containing protein n=1 Tax=unclassified Mesorhizobium TaxID=325217 RepID=UPI000FCC82DD|nr:MULTISPECIES: helix-turn-helix domain-containing protein [unclassified Mesorhizobium]TGP75016.1 helix-turn-helix domain-containing protein [bacterium M00.F.Ca.ET.227.01.1.1]TGP85343.1 helix-turn-helix domain-containing protein [bacterium M00.F.Ca.ET.221.01.1.1]TGP89769.1 helix-turn-helix domain-containing protein [bacterium M00.F.Ca.ET.222.01.1.1]TGT67730.1 helix-turn-helix domain-containing protein [bacterium M00.F.Ca.ET.159.01.1.1]TGT80170.1 helix-turn-helix domain-containing protein [bac